ncbi:hypothetical protein QR680_009991 [Steinernema hermaphroditum]|uniref:Uncharacterized protein n=1 Tax=Steinernema hermaphroditum TaxID=289476 RepID=A0AA39INK8_9BILA|nr:hypothetical protein QR680_009991 [Steinernema hermaphroditum]
MPAFNIVFPPFIPHELVADDATYSDCTEAAETKWVGANVVFTEHGRIIEKTEFKNWTYNSTDFKTDL